MLTNQYIPRNQLAEYQIQEKLVDGQNVSNFYIAFNVPNNSIIIKLYLFETCCCVAKIMMISISY